jgi:hypothetical protein
LIALAVATKQRPNPAEWERRVRPTVTRFCETMDGIVDHGILREALALIDAAPPCPTVFEHHDFAPWNIYVMPAGRLAALDWDNSDQAGLPGFDLVQCHGYLAFTVDRALGTRQYALSHRTREAGPLGQIRRECRARYADAIGLTGNAMRAIRAFAWMSLAADDVVAWRALGAAMTRNDIERSVAGLWEAETRSALRESES